ncbi:translation initiation factor IF-2 [Triticum aestivum]|nr:translation initiation factor IF-2 [Aegilops tauschii subsp. strangulata]XP_044376481.1 translation initiation factor IF-2-like [Triticum aestivum]
MNALPCPATLLLRQADPRCFSAPPSQLEFTPPTHPAPVSARRETSRRACVWPLSLAGEARRRLEITPLPSLRAAHALAQCGGASRRPVVTSRGQERKITAPRSRGKSGRGVAWYCGPGCRPSVRPSHQRAFQYNHPREAETIAIVAPAAALPPFRVGARVSFALSPPRPSPSPTGPAPGPPRRGGLAPAGSRPRDAAGSECRAMGNGAKAADDVREGQLKLMDQCLAATSLAVVHTALLWGLANLI